MRPVKRPDLLDEQRNHKTFTDYQNARPELIAAFGEYCSYCEMHLDASLAVEHVQPKSLHPGLALLWDNFLLGCSNCNSIKNDKDPGLGNCLWPDRDNTLIAFLYTEGGVVEVNPALNSKQYALAQELMDLVGLDRKVENATASDRRWVNRLDAWGKAERALARLAKRDDNEFREQIVETAESKGYWSVWMTVFGHDVDMRQRLINAMPGTAKTCFDAQTNALSRVHGFV